MSDEDHARAASLLAAAMAKPSADAPGWTCPRCREEVPGTFGSCWACDATPI